MVVGMLNESNTRFLEYLTSDYAKNVFVKSDMKIHVETNNIYHKNVNMNESIYDFLAAQENTTEILLVYKIDPTIIFKHYLKEIIASVKNERDDLNTNCTSKFFFYHFNNFRNDHNLHSFKISHTKI